MGRGRSCRPALLAWSPHVPAGSRRSISLELMPPSVFSRAVAVPSFSFRPFLLVAPGPPACRCDAIVLSTPGLRERPTRCAAQRGRGDCIDGDCRLCVGAEGRGGQARGRAREGGGELEKENIPVRRYNVRATTSARCIRAQKDARETLRTLGEDLNAPVRGRIFMTVQMSNRISPLPPLLYFCTQCTITASTMHSRRGRSVGLQGGSRVCRIYQGVRELLGRGRRISNAPLQG